MGRVKKGICGGQTNTSGLERQYGKELQKKLPKIYTHMKKIQMIHHIMRKKTTELDIFYHQLKYSVVRMVYILLRHC